MMRKILGLMLAAGACGLAQPAAAQQACAAGPFVVYFEEGQDSLTPDAAQVLDNAASAYLACDKPEVTIAGHTDRKGDEAYNVGLSQRMALNVRAYLAGRGVHDGMMTVEAYGEARLAIETADGEVEVLNRRVEVTFGPKSGW